MKIVHTTSDRIEFSDTGSGFTRMLKAFLAAIVLLVVAGALFSGDVIAILLVLLVAGLFWKLADHVNVDSQAVLDRSDNSFHVIQTRGGSTLVDLSGPLDDIENVILESSVRSNVSDERLTARPVLIVGGKSVPLTFASFVNGPVAVDIAKALREYLNLPQAGLFDDSIDRALREPAGTGRAVRLARFGLGMGRLAAAGHVDRLRKKQTADMSRLPNHAISREKP